jgi:hypothetical protein
MNHDLSDLEVRFELAERFSKDFRDLVRKYVPDRNAEGATDLLFMIGDRTSVFSPHVWSDS